MKCPDAKTITDKQRIAFITDWSKICALRKWDKNFKPIRLQFISESIGRRVESMNEVGYLKEYDKLKAACQAILNPSSVGAQLRQQRMPRTRLLQKITVEQTALLAVYLDPPDPRLAAENYILSVIADQFGRLFAQDSSRSPKTVLDLTDKQLEHLRFTLAARIDDRRAAAGHTKDQMRRLAGLVETETDCVLA